MTFGDAGCCGLLLPLADGQKDQRDSVIKGNLIPASRSVCGIRRGNGAHAVEVGTETLFLLEGKLIGVWWLEISIRLLGS